MKMFLFCLAEGKLATTLRTCSLLVSDGKMQTSAEEKNKFEFVDSKEGTNGSYSDICYHTDAF